MTENGRRPALGERDVIRIRADPISMTEDGQGCVRDVSFHVGRDDLDRQRGICSKDSLIEVEKHALFKN
jgi:hypothetical protein